jgi:hypothetical protein
MMIMKMISANVDEFVCPSLPTHSSLIIIFHLLKMNQIQYDGVERDYQFGYHFLIAQIDHYNLINWENCSYFLCS